MRYWRFSALLVSAAITAACNDAIGPGGSGPQVSLSFSAGALGTPSTVSGVAMSAAADFTITDGLNELAVTKAEVVLREIELKRSDVVDCDDDPSSDDCQEFEAGPVLIDLPLDGSTAQAVAVDIPAGSYDEVEFEIHKISSDDARDDDFRNTHPDFADVSIRVQGLYNGQAFTYETDLDVEQEFDLMPPLVISGDQTSPTNVTVRIALSQWFLNGAGDLVDPATGNKGGANESLVKENIKQSIEAFEDVDHDGDEDDIR